MDDVPVTVDKNITVVTILDLEQVCKQRVCSERTHKSTLCLWQLRSIGFLIELVQTVEVLRTLLEPIYGDGICHELEYSRTLVEYDDLVRPEV